MSTSLYVRPAVRQPDGDRIGTQLQWVLARGGYFDHDGSCETDWFVMSAKDVPFLRGVIAAGDCVPALRGEAEALVAMIDRYGEVEVSLQ